MTPNSTSHGSSPTAGWPRSAHLIGIGGAGLRALAELLRDQGSRVTGSDTSPGPHSLQSLQAVGIEVGEGHDPAQIPVNCERVIYSAAIPPDNVELAAARARGIPVQSYPQYLGELARQFDAVCVAGTHGKSTSTALVGSILRAHGEDGQLICGGELLESGRAGWGGNGHRVIVESCEFRRHFLQLTPHTLVITGIEWDHVDCYASLSDTIDAFAGLLRGVRDDGLIIYRSDCQASCRAIAAARVHGRCGGPGIVTCGHDSHADWKIGSPPTPARDGELTLSGPNGVYLQLRAPLPGQHNADNAAIAAVTCLELGVPQEVVRQTIQRFAGLRRRMQYLGEWRGISIWDDYAHHPTAIRAVVNSLRQRYPQRRITIAFQPHQIQRTLVMRDAFVAALALADHSWILPAYTAREASSDQSETVSRELSRQIGDSGGRSSFVPSLDRLPGDAGD